MSDLREKLAQRLWLVSLGDKAPDSIIHWPNHFAMEGWRKLADECIRQMEWARRECAGVDSMTGANHGIDGTPLTSAPDDWKPE